VLKPAVLIAIATTAPLVGLLGWRGLGVLPFTMAWLGVVTWKQIQRTPVGRHRRDRVPLAPVAKVQTVTCTESPFDRRAAMAGLQVDTAGGRLLQIRIPYLGREIATSLYERLAAQAAHTAFRW